MSLLEEILITFCFNECGQKTFPLKKHVVSKALSRQPWIKLDERMHRAGIHDALGKKLWGSSSITR